MTTSLQKVPISRACSGVKAVPSVATAFSNPAWFIAMTSIYPSARMRVPSALFFAKFSEKRLRLFLKTGVSGEFKYLGLESSITRPPKPMTFFRRSMIGKTTRLRKVS